ncbi:hypothetical protein [Cognatilysobacter lacus]|uniref:Uncharacterized protein n=1 Tax=Cognatilysobacter lacus TaxID=1643323 RepID=A0A5D8Z8B4_9GAMM|nr:hypothetical protein [Lysobacter lacus]TZF90880.1 hypothetical protein FW784_03500 [Lysobacter lacus]
MPEPLGDLAHLLECAALDYRGQLKTELADLCKCPEGASDGYALDPVQSELRELVGSLGACRAGRNNSGAGTLSAIGRRCWRMARSPR